MSAIAEDPLKTKKTMPSPELPLYSRGIEKSKATYVTMSAKARGAKCHNGPLELRKSREPRDCTAWVRDDKQYAPYTTLDSANNLPAPKPKKVPVPPTLWLPPRAKDPKEKRAAKAVTGDTLPLGAEAGEDEATAVSEVAKEPGAEPLERRPQWDAEHHIMHSRMNHQIQAGTREYFDRPVRKEGEGVPKVREQYAMNDRQCGWNDEPAPLGEYRRTLYDNIGPYNVGGCKEHQLPSYWRKIQYWDCFSSPDLKVSVSGGGRPLERNPNERPSLLQALADTPAEQAKEFWREWAEQRSAPRSLPDPNRWEQPKGWDNRWNICPSKVNDLMNPRSRQYFAVPQGVSGTTVEAPRARQSSKALQRAASVYDRWVER